MTTTIDPFEALQDVEAATMRLRRLLENGKTDSPPPPNHYAASVLGVAKRFIGIKEIPGSRHNAAIVAMLQLDTSWAHSDEIPWCSGFANYVAWLLGLERTRSLRARSWLTVGEPVEVADALAGDVVIFSRGNWRPGPDVIKAPGHVGFLHHIDGPDVLVLGGNQGNSVSVAPYKAAHLLGVRRLRQVESEGSEVG